MGYCHSVLDTESEISLNTRLRIKFGVTVSSTLTERQSLTGEIFKDKPSHRLGFQKMGRQLLRNASLSHRECMAQGLVKSSKTSPVIDWGSKRWKARLIWICLILSFVGIREHLVLLLH
jgi:hypothetical protein